MPGVKTKVQNQMMESMTKNNSYVPAAEDVPRVSKIFKGEDLLECAGDAPTLYGRKIARKLWSREELSNPIMSPGKDWEFREYPRSPMTPTRKLSSMVNSFFARIVFRK